MRGAIAPRRRGHAIAGTGVGNGTRLAIARANAISAFARAFTRRFVHARSLIPGNPPESHSGPH